MTIIPRLLLHYSQVKQGLVLDVEILGVNGSDVQFQYEYLEKNAAFQKEPFTRHDLTIYRDILVRISTIQGAAEMGGFFYFFFTALMHDGSYVTPQGSRHVSHLLSPTAPPPPPASVPHCSTCARRPWPRSTTSTAALHRSYALRQGVADPKTCSWSSIVFCGHPLGHDLHCLPCWSSQTCS
jgi:hypothetical protein